MATDRAVLEGSRLPLLAFHQALIQAERRRYAAAHGPVTPVEFLQQLLTSETLGWLKPMTALILEIDERLDDKTASPQALAESLGRLRALVTSGQESGLVQRVSESPELPALWAAVGESLGSID